VEIRARRGGAGRRRRVSRGGGRARQTAVELVRAGNRRLGERAPSCGPPAARQAPPRGPPSAGGASSHATAPRGVTTRFSP
jgi:hypothetical protein